MCSYGTIFFYHDDKFAQYVMQICPNKHFYSPLQKIGSNEVPDIRVKIKDANIKKHTNVSRRVFKKYLKNYKRRLIRGFTKINQMKQQPCLCKHIISHTLFH